MNSTVFPIKNHYRPDEVAQYFDVTVWTVYRWCREEKLIHFQLESGGIRIRREALLQFETNFTAQNSTI